MNRQLLIKDIVQQSGNYLLNNFQKLQNSQIGYKKHHEVVTSYDRESERRIIKAIKKHFPQDAILAEESGEKRKREAQYLWVIDPLDGTHNFVIGSPIFSVSIALFKLNEKNNSNAYIEHGAIYWPVMKNLYFASKGKGAWLNSKKIKVNENDQWLKARLTYCSGGQLKDKVRSLNYYAALRRGGLEVRQLGSAAIELALVASGKIDSIVIPGAHAWDVAAGILLVREAGGLVTDLDNKDWELNSKDMIATNGLLHKKIIKEFNNAQSKILY